MTKEITKAKILQEMQDKLMLREFDPTKFLFSETVIPTYDIEQHLESWWMKYVTKNIIASGAMEFFVVPEGERWYVKRYDVVFRTGVYTVAGVYLVRRNRDPSDCSMYLDLAAAQSVSYHAETDVVLAPGDSVRINIDGYTSTGELRLYIDYKMEEIR